MISLILVIGLLGFVRSATINTDVQRTIDLTTPVVRMTIDLKASNIDKEYLITFPDTLASHLAYLSVTRKGKPIKTTAPVTYELEISMPQIL